MHGELITFDKETVMFTKSACACHVSSLEE